MTSMKTFACLNPAKLAEIKSETSKNKADFDSFFVTCLRSIQTFKFIEKSVQPGP